VDKFIIEGGKKLKGTVKINGAKNAVLPIMAATLLTGGITTLKNVPDIKDVRTMEEVLRRIGAEVTRKGSTLKINPNKVIYPEAPYELVRKMRASFVVLGPLLSRLSRAKVSMPGGCALGARPVNLHLKGLARLGAEIKIIHGYVEAKVRKLKGNVITLDYPSVGATQNIIMAACRAKGKTIIENAALEPEIVDLAAYLNKCGAHIIGAGTETIEIHGVSNLYGIDYTVIPDRLEAATFLLCGAITGGDVTVKNVIPEHLKIFLEKLNDTGITLEIKKKSIKVKGTTKIQPVDIKAMPYPAFPTDLQPQMMALLTVARGTSVITETVFENRFMHVPELQRMGADLKVRGNSVTVRGVKSLSGAPVMASDIRAGAALVIAALRAEGITEISRVYHIDRGYEALEKKLSLLNANIKRIKS